MKKLILFLAFVIVSMSLYSQTAQQEFRKDYGPPDYIYNDDKVIYHRDLIWEGRFDVATMAFFDDGVLTQMALIGYPEEMERVIDYARAEYRGINEMGVVFITDDFYFIYNSPNDNNENKNSSMEIVPIK